MGATTGAGTAYPSRTPEFTPGFRWGSCYSIFSFMCMFCRSLFALLPLFLLSIVLFVLRFTDSDYTFGIFKLFTTNKILIIKPDNNEGWWFVLFQHWNLLQTKLSNSISDMFLLEMLIILLHTYI